MGPLPDLTAELTHVLVAQTQPTKTGRPILAYVMALEDLTDDENLLIFYSLRDPCEPCISLAFASMNKGVWKTTKVQRQQLKDENEHVAKLARKLGGEGGDIFGVKGVRYRGPDSWVNKLLRKARYVNTPRGDITCSDMALLGRLGSFLPELERLTLQIPSFVTTQPMQLFAENLRVGALLTLTSLRITYTHMGDVGASALAAAVSRGALPRLKCLKLQNVGIGDLGFKALVPALQQIHELMALGLKGNRLGDEGVTALVAPGRALKCLKILDVDHTNIRDIGCKTLATGIINGTLPALRMIRVSCGYRTLLSAWLTYGAKTHYMASTMQGWIEF